MKKKDVLKFFGGVNATARALAITPASVSGWGEDVPRSRIGHIRLAMDAENMKKGAEAP